VLQRPPFSSIDWPQENHQHLNHTASSNTRNCFTAVLPHRQHKSSLHFLWGWSNTTKLHLHPHRSLPSGPTVPVYTASFTDMPSPLTAHGSTWRCSKVIPCRRHTTEIQSFAPSAKYSLVMPRLTGSNKTSINAHYTHCWGHAFKLN
jgi:hypothetical protein